MDALLNNILQTFAEIQDAKTKSIKKRKSTQFNEWNFLVTQFELNLHFFNQVKNKLEYSNEYLGLIAQSGSK